MNSIADLLQSNNTWAEAVQAHDPEFFAQSAQGQAPTLLWIGCSDSRVSTEIITGLGPGEVFVHRNVANLVPENDLSSLSVIEYAVAALNVTHIIVCGHYKCGGVKAVLDDATAGVLDAWLSPVKELKEAHRGELVEMEDEEQWEWMCELNVQSQVEAVANLQVVQNAWESGQALQVHGFIYDIAEGKLNDLGITRSELA